MKRGMRPLVRAADVAVLDRVPMDVVEMTLEIVFTFERVFPVSAAARCRDDALVGGPARPRGHALGPRAIAS